jgi:hypothetical protein
MSVRRWVLIAVAVATVALASLGVAIAGEGGSLTDDPNPPPPPPSKVADVDQPDAPRDGSQTTHTHPPEADDESREPRTLGGGDFWGCVRPDGSGRGVTIHRPTLEMLKIMRDDVASRRTSDPEYTPTLDLSDFDFPEDCVPMDGMPSLDEYVIARSPLAVVNPDGTLKSDAELAEIAGPSGP